MGIECEWCEDESSVLGEDGLVDAGILYLLWLLVERAAVDRAAGPGRREEALARALTLQGVTTRKHTVTLKLRALNSARLGTSPPSCSPPHRQQTDDLIRHTRQ